MSHKFIATVVAAALAVATIGNAPARADDDAVRALAAIVGVAVVGAIINHELKDRKKEKKKEKVVTRHKNRPTAQVWDYNDRSDNVIRRAEPRPLPKQVRRKLLPGQCLRSFETRDGRARVFGKKCLKENYAYNRSLPRACAVKFRTHKKKRHGYDARCLRREGYQLARW